MAITELFSFLFQGSGALKAALMITLVLIMGFISLYFYIVPSQLTDFRRKSLPPGPRGIPFIGNMLDLADSDLVPETVQRWFAQHGDVFYTKIGGSDYIWLSSPKAVKDLMDKKSSVYSSRPPLPLAQDVASAGRRQLFMEYGPKWRSIRKMFHQHFHQAATPRYRDKQTKEIHAFLRRCLEQPVGRPLDPRCIRL